MKCLKCPQNLKVVKLYSGMEIETCPECDGAFFDAGELAVELKIEDPPDGFCSCPKCGKLMQYCPLFERKLFIDRCPGCGGIWLDGGEVEKLRALTGRQDIVAGGGNVPSHDPLKIAFTDPAVPSGIRLRSWSRGRRRPTNFWDVLLALALGGEP